MLPKPISPLPVAGGRLQRYPAATRYEAAKRKSERREDSTPFSTDLALRIKTNHWCLSIIIQPLMLAIKYYLVPISTLPPFLNRSWEIKYPFIGFPLTLISVIPLPLPGLVIVNNFPLLVFHFISSKSGAVTI